VINPTKGEKTYIRYHMIHSGRVTVQVFTMDGNLIKVLRREHRGAGEWTEVWDGKNNGNHDVARGMYFVRVVGPDLDEIRKVIVVK
jgi:flagellar hook assembly protein FlgD